VFDLQDDLVPRIAATVADQTGVLVHSMIEVVRSRDPLQLTPHEALLRAFGIHERYTPAEHADVRGLLERAVEQAPGHADCWAMLSWFYTAEFVDGFNALPDPLGRAVAAAQQAVGFAPTNSLAHSSLAKALYFSREFEAFRLAADRCIALNPLDAASIAFMGLLVAYAGDWTRGCALVRRAHDLNPHHTGLYWFGDCYNAYRQGDYPAALEAALKLNMPGYYSVHAVLAAIHAQLGRGEDAAKSLQKLLALRPDYAARARTEIGKWNGNDPEFVAHLIDGLRKAGLKMEEPPMP
jgi:adenylate cyclase